MHEENQRRSEEQGRLYHWPRSHLGFVHNKKDKAAAPHNDGNIYAKEPLRGSTWRQYATEYRDQARHDHSVATMCRLISLNSFDCSDGERSHQVNSLEFLHEYGSSGHVGDREIQDVNGHQGNESNGNIHDCAAGGEVRS